MTAIRLALNVIWLVTAGFWLALSYVLFGVIACLLVITFPFGVASFRIASFALWPFGREIIKVEQPSGLGGLGNIIWFIFGGLWIALAHISIALIQAITIIGLPLAWANIKMLPVACFPFGKRIVSSEEHSAMFLPRTGH